MDARPQRKVYVPKWAKEAKEAKGFSKLQTALPEPGRATARLYIRGSTVACSSMSCVRFLAVDSCHVPLERKISTKKQQKRETTEARQDAKRGGSTISSFAR